MRKRFNPGVGEMIAVFCNDWLVLRFGKSFDIRDDFVGSRTFGLLMTSHNFVRGEDEVLITSLSVAG